MGFGERAGRGAEEKEGAKAGGSGGTGGEG